MESIEKTNQENQLSFSGLTAMIIGSTIGAGIFTTAGDMASNGAHTASVLIGWGICGIGMYSLMMSFSDLIESDLILLTGFTVMPKKVSESL